MAARADFGVSWNDHSTLVQFSSINLQGTTMPVSLKPFQPSTDLFLLPSLSLANLLVRLLRWLLAHHHPPHSVSLSLWGISVLMGRNYSVSKLRDTLISAVQDIHLHCSQSITPKAIPWTFSRLGFSYLEDKPLISHVPTTVSVLLMPSLLSSLYGVFLASCSTFVLSRSNRVRLCKPWSTPLASDFPPTLSLA